MKANYKKKLVKGKGVNEYHTKMILRIERTSLDSNKSLRSTVFLQHFEVCKGTYLNRKGREPLALTCFG